MYIFRSFYIPERMQESVDRWVEYGILPGNFLRAIIENNLKDAVAYADDENIKNIPAFVSFFYNMAPAECWGSREKMMKWHEKMHAADVSNKPKEQT